MAGRVANFLAGLSDGAVMSLAQRFGAAAPDMAGLKTSGARSEAVGAWFQSLRSQWPGDHLELDLDAMALLTDWPGKTALETIANLNQTVAREFEGLSGAPDRSLHLFLNHRQRFDEALSRRCEIASRRSQETSEFVFLGANAGPQQLPLWREGVESVCQHIREKTGQRVYWTHHESSVDGEQRMDALIKIETEDELGERFNKEGQVEPFLVPGVKELRLIVIPARGVLSVLNPKGGKTGRMRVAEQFKTGAQAGAFTIKDIYERKPDLSTLLDGRRLFNPAPDRIALIRVTEIGYIYRPTGRKGDWRAEGPKDDGLLEGLTGQVGAQQLPNHQIDRALFHFLIADCQGSRSQSSGYAALYHNDKVIFRDSALMHEGLIEQCLIAWGILEDPNARSAAA